jgi:hypothetical protein
MRENYEISMKVERILDTRWYPGIITGITSGGDDDDNVEYVNLQYDDATREVGVNTAFIRKFISSDDYKMGKVDISNNVETSMEVSTGKRGQVIHNESSPSYIHAQLMLVK